MLSRCGSVPVLPHLIGMETPVGNRYLTRMELWEFEKVKILHNLSHIFRGKKYIFRILSLKPLIFLFNGVRRKKTIQPVMEPKDYIKITIYGRLWGHLEVNKWPGWSNEGQISNFITQAPGEDHILLIWPKFDQKGYLFYSWPKKNTRNVVVHINISSNTFMFHDITIWEQLFF